MRWLLAPDSYKGSLSAAEVAQAMRRGLLRADPAAECVLKPMADGGEGTLDALHAASGGEWLSLPSLDAVGRAQEVACLRLPNGMVVVEVARIVGLPQAGETAVLQRHSGGVGSVLRQLRESGVRRIAVALGGSSTNDGGAGCLAALGAEWRDATGGVLDGSPAQMAACVTLLAEGLREAWRDVELEIWSDVDNPLTGSRGATAVFGAQKGVSADVAQALDAGIEAWAGELDALHGEAVRLRPGSGAAGGLGYALQWLGGCMRSGAEAVAEHTGLAAALTQADWALSGEGRSDSQTLSGKAPACVAALAATAGVPVSLISGAVEADAEGRLAQRFQGMFSLCNRPMTLAMALDEAAERVAECAEQLARAILAARRGG
ncbi:glycerate kinase [uncultured Aquitalea sp.]|uniref:glycerate kinase n=1 Tax=uncultured Aquitalea sp. TaxID=540272 RepID=UPI0025EFB5AD|nr:glycerate kinase [uncultured Aquitalea sp.]